MYQTVWKQIRHGWCVGGADFEEFLLNKLQGVVAEHKRESYSGMAIERHDEVQAENMIQNGMKTLGITNADLERQRKGSRDKCLLAWLAQSETLATQRWISERLRMGRTSSVGTYAKRIHESADPDVQRLRRMLAKCT